MQIQLLNTSTSELSTANEAAEDLFVDLLAEIILENFTQNEERNRLRQDQHS